MPSNKGTSEDKYGKFFLLSPVLSGSELSSRPSIWGGAREGKDKLDTLSNNGDERQIGVIERLLILSVFVQSGSLIFFLYLVTHQSVEEISGITLKPIGCLHIKCTTDYQRIIKNDGNSFIIFYKTLHLVLKFVLVRHCRHTCYAGYYYRTLVAIH